MISYFIKAFSFFIKEIHDVRRQPRLMISLVGGPLIVLALFGATFRSANPFIEAALVWPENGIPGIDQEQAVKFISSNFHLVKVTSDKDEAMQMLENGDVDVVQIVPETGVSFSDTGARPEIQVLSRTVDPQVEAWIRSLSYGETNFINQPHQFFRFFGIHPGRRFIQQKQGRSRRQGPDDFQPPLLPIG